MLNQLFITIRDHRVTGRCTYALNDLLTNALLTFMAGGEDYVDMSDFAASRARSFGLFADVDSSPSPDTFERLMSAVDPAEIERCLIEYGKNFLDTLAQKQIVIDGKKLRGTAPRQKGEKGDYLLNAFVSENHLFIGQTPLQDKENEMRAIPRLLDKLDITEAVVSIDAIGTQVNIARDILDKGGHYFLAVKDNQGSLKEAVVNAFKYTPPLDSAEQMDADHGRIETRKCRILDVSSIDDPVDNEAVSRWPALKTLVEVTSLVEHVDKAANTSRTTQTTRHYISDEDFPKAAYFNMIARGHWAIENNLHWCLDVLFKEDACRSRKGFAAQNLSLVRKLALQWIKLFPDKRSLRKRMYKSAIDNDYLVDMLTKLKF